MPPVQSSCFLKLLSTAALVGVSATAGAEPPNINANGRATTSIDRALESRSRVFAQSTERRAGAESPTASGGAFAHSNASAAQSGSLSKGQVSTAASAQAEGSGSARSFDIESRTHFRNSLTPHSEMSRFGREVSHDARTTLKGRGASSFETFFATSRRNARADFDRDAHREPQSPTQRELHLSAHGSVAGTSASTGGTGDTPASAEGANKIGIEGRRRGTENASFEIRADQFLSVRLAQIDRMRDTALERGDENLLRQADRLETLARAQYSQRVDGTASVGAAMRDFNATQRDTRSEQEIEMEATSEHERLSGRGKSNATATSNVAARTDLQLDHTPVTTLPATPGSTQVTIDGETEIR